MAKTPKPTTLDVLPAAAQFRTDMLSQFEIDDAAGLAILDSATVQLSRMLDARERIAADGPVIKDRFGQLKPHPALGIESRAGSAFRMLLRELGVCEGPEQIEPIPRPKGRK